MRAIVSKTFSFDAAHQLVGHSGKCANLHGHTYSLTVAIEGQIQEAPGSSQGMVIDYTNLDRVVKPLINALDHSFISEGTEPSRPTTGKVFDLGRRSTAENIAAHAWAWIRKALQQEFELSDLPLKVWFLTVTVSETPKTAATISGEVVA